MPTPLPSSNALPAPASRLAVFIATGAGLGRIPVAPGTFGSLGGVLLFFVLARPGLPIYLLSLLALTFLGVWASDVAERHFERVDDGRIVIDEVVGQLVTFTPLVALKSGFFRSADLALLVTGFVLFRVFDIWKPGPVGWAERRFEGGVGVMADDCVAGLLSGALLLGIQLGVRAL